MSIAAHSRTDDTGKARLPMLAAPLAALLYPFALKGFNASVTRIADGVAGAFAFSWLSAAVYLALAFAMPLIAMLAAMSLSGIGRPTAAQLRAKRAALLASSSFVRVRLRASGIWGDSEDIWTRPHSWTTRATIASTASCSWTSTPKAVPPPVAALSTTSKRSTP